MTVDVTKRPAYLDWIDRSGDCEDNWDYRSFKEYPPGDSEDKIIIDFVDDAKEAEKAIQEDLIDEGLSRREAEEQACQWPLRDDAPMEIVREYIGYQYELQEMAKRGEDA